ncbi:MAG: PhnD/SsuA/transferrin family substrate-binding protein, partial [Candidatus Promineifilaceae bacterium]
MSLLLACQTTVPTDPQVIEATRLVVETEQIVATVQVPVEITREIFIPVTVEVAQITEVIEAEIGSAENPIQLIFSPRYGEQVTQARGGNFAAALTDASDLAFEIVTPTSYQAAIDAACAAPERTIAFLTAQTFVLAHKQCNLQIGYAGIRDGINWQASMITVPELDNGELGQLSDLEGRTWGVQRENNFVDS